MLRRPVATVPHAAAAAAAAAAPAGRPALGQWSAVASGNRAPSRTPELEESGGAEVPSDADGGAWGMRAKGGSRPTVWSGTTAADARERWMEAGKSADAPTINLHSLLTASNSPPFGSLPAPTLSLSDVLAMGAGASQHQHQQQWPSQYEEVNPHGFSSPISSDAKQTAVASAFAALDDDTQG